MKKIVCTLPYTVILFILVIHLVTLFPAANFALSSGESGEVEIVKSLYSSVRQQEEDRPYYYYGIKIISENGISLVFRENSCVLAGQKNVKYSSYWIYITEISPGISFVKQAPVLTRRFPLKFASEEMRRTALWTVSKVNGPEGMIEIIVPPGGSVSLHFLWEVPEDFSPDHVKIDNIVNTFLAQ